MSAQNPPKDPDPARKKPHAADKASREERLAEQLRANLRRRKQAAREDQDKVSLPAADETKEND